MWDLLGREREVRNAFWSQMTFWNVLVLTLLLGLRDWQNAPMYCRFTCFPAAVARGPPLIF
jgi:hypothetical protein